jgi:non-ribosomal peptide synthase protein (TIGR01720 family)
MEAASLDLTDNPVARLIAAAWRTVLGRDSLDANENFFELGGDSIKAIQIVTRLAEAGIRLEVADLFESPTVAQLASRLRTGGSSIGRAPIPEGPIPLTPIQTWFARAHADHLHHFNMGVLFRGRIRLDQGAVEEVIKAIIAHHDALRMTYRIEEGRLVQETTAHADAFELDILRIEPEETVLAKVASWATRAGTSFDLASGPLVRAGLFTSENGDHLALLFHHILVDAVSMRFLIEDFAAAYEQRMRGESIRLVEKTDPFAAWAHALQRHATSDELLRELPYWTSVVASGRDLPRRAESAEKSLVTDGVTIKESFDEAATTRFTTSMNRLFKARTDEVLLAALALALSRWSGASRTLLFMEGHGREPISEPVDLTRTVGWFTTVFPVVLEASPGVGLADLVHRARDHLRRIPTRGLGFGVLKYLTPPDLLRGADLAIRGDLLFNYLGQIDQESDGIIEIIDAPLGVMAPTTSMEYPMTLEAMIFEGRLEFVLTVDPAVYSPDEARDLLAHLRVALEEILAHDEVPRPAPSDLTFAGLTSEELDRVITDI